MDIQYTPGPWKLANILPDEKHLQNDSTRNHFTMETENETSIEVWYDITDFESIQKAQANARLIEAAPELLEALESILTSHRLGNGIDKGYFEDADKAIKKALGA